MKSARLTKAGSTLRLTFLARRQIDFARAHRPISAIAQAGGQLTSIPEYTEADKLLPVGSCAPSNHAGDVACSKAEVCVGRALDIVANLPGEMGANMKQAALRRASAVADACGRSEAGLTAIAKLEQLHQQQSNSGSASSPSALLDRGELLLAKVRANLGALSLPGSSSDAVLADFRSLYSELLRGIDAAEDAAGGRWQCPTVGQHARAIEYAEAALTGARLHALAAAVSRLASPLDRGSVVATSRDAASARNSAPEEDVLPPDVAEALQDMRTSRAASQLPETASDKHLVVAVTLAAHVVACADVITGAPDADLKQMRFAVWLQARATIVLATARRNMASANCLSAALELNSSTGIAQSAANSTCNKSASPREPASLIASAHTQLSEALAEVEKAITQLSGLRRDELTPPIASAFARSDGDLQLLRMGLLTCLGECGLISGLLSVWSGALSGEQRSLPLPTASSSSSATPLFPLSPSDSDYIAPVLKSVSELAQKGLKEAEAIAERINGNSSGNSNSAAGSSSDSKGALLLSSDNGREEPSLLLARPLRLIGALQHLSQMAVMSEGLYRSVIDSLDAYDARCAGKAAAANNSSSSGEGSGYLMGLPLLPAASIAAPLLHSYGVLLSQWDKREGEAARRLRQGDALFAAALRRIVLTRHQADADTAQLAPASSHVGYLQRQLLGCAFGCLHVGSYGFSLPLDVAALAPPPQC